MLPSTSSSSPQKRKHNEYRDPDYPTEYTEDATHATGSGSGGSGGSIGSRGSGSIGKRFRDERAEYTATSPYSERGANQLQRIREIIAREFQQEITFKQEQVEEIDERITQARHLLDRLRYAIVADYYGKQELPLTQSEAAAVRGSQTLFDNESEGPQMTLHPSVRKIIGKRPSNYKEILRPCPERAAAQSAKQTIRMKTAEQKRQDRRIQQTIRDQGIVIDHSKQQNVDSTEVGSAAATAPRKSPIAANVDAPSTSVAAQRAGGNALNVTRLNNKARYLVVVGNTSKYIGGEGELEHEQKPGGQILSHKWLVYVRSKDNSVRLEDVVRKVRFFLHASYRPNNIVDISTPPFQLARRGWGEFPMRIQLFFHEHLQQKPLQLVHHLVLDKTLSGLHTMGAETLMEIWLRSDQLRNKTPTQTPTPAAAAAATSTTAVQQRNVVVDTSPPTSSKPRTISFTHNKEELDDNLFEFLNKIGEMPTSICADIEKLQPTVVVTEPLAVCKVSPIAAKKCETRLVGATAAPIVAQQLWPTPPHQPAKVDAAAAAKLARSPEKLPAASKPVGKVISKQNGLSPEVVPPQASTAIAAGPTQSAPTATATTPQKQEANNSLPMAKTAPTTAIVHSPRVVSTTATTTTTTTTTPTMATATTTTITTTAATATTITTTKPTIFRIQNSNQAILLNRMAKLPTASAAGSTATSPANSLQLQQLANGGPKKILQKKLVQLVDGNGNIKYVQMLVATSTVPTAARPLNAAATPKTITTTAKIGPHPTLTQIPASQVKQLTLKPASQQKVEQSKPPHCPAIPGAAGAAANTANNCPPAKVELNNQTPLNTPHNNHVSKMAHHHNSIATNSNISANNGGAPKNVVFQKEGKLYIIDPVQMKLKQQQKKQVSLLKPQVSLLKQQHLQQQQQQQQQQRQQNSMQSVAYDHNYTPAPLKPLVMQTPLQTPLQLPTPTPTPPPLHLGIRQTRVNASNLQEQQQKLRMDMEEQFLREQFPSIRTAVEYLLRRTPLVAAKETVAAAYPFVRSTLEEFQSLPAFKQRACEWLRAKHIARHLRNHKALQQLHERHGNEAFWSTREILMFARYYAYTPVIKGLLHGTAAAEPDHFAALVKSELRHEQCWQYDTLTVHGHIGQWVCDMWQQLQQHEETVNDTQIIDVDGIDNEAHEAGAAHNKRIPTAVAHLKYNNGNSSSSSSIAGGGNMLHLPPPERLENEFALLTDICKDIDVRLQPEEIASGVMHPMAQTLMAQSLRLFIERLIRQAVATKLLQQQQHQHQHLSGGGVGVALELKPQDIGKVIANSSGGVGEFDFLTNRYLGTTLYDEQDQPKAEL